jgi:uncharacterized membrane protein
MLELLAFIAIVGLLVGPLIALIAFVRVRSLEGLRGRVDELETEVAELRRRLREVATPAPITAAPPRVETPAPAPPPVVHAPPPAAKVASQPARPPAPPPASPPPPRSDEPAEPPSPPPSSSIDWERWIGIRGAAVLGAIVLALAGLLFFQYSIQHGLLTPPMRVTLGLAVGIAAIVGAELLRPRGYQQTPDAMAGAGLVVLYAALWAGHTLYGLIPMMLCFALMALVTVVGGLLAVRHASRLVAVLGLIGGFATPLLLRSDADRPIGLFGYVLLLDLGLLAVGKKKGWPWLSLLGLAGTALLQGLWIGARMGPDRAFLGLAILAIFAALFAAAGFMGGEGDRSTLRISQAGALLLPFLFSVYFAARVDLGPHLWPTAMLLALLSAAASWIGARQQMPFLPPAAALGSLGVFAVWLARAPGTAAASWEAVAVASAIALIFHLFVETGPEAAAETGVGPAAMIAAIGFLASLIIGAAHAAEPSPWIWLVGWIALAILLYRHASFPGRAPLTLPAAIGVALGMSLQRLQHEQAPGFPPVELFFGVAIAVGLAAQAMAMIRGAGPYARFANHAAGAFAAIVMLFFAFSPGLAGLPPALGLGIPIALSVMILLTATRGGAGEWSLAALVVMTGAELAWSMERSDLRVVDGRVALLMIVAAAILFVAWPFIAGKKLAAERMAWNAAALAGPLAFFPARHLWVLTMGRGAIGALPLVLGGLALAAAAGARRAPIEDAEVRKTALVWLAAVAISFVSIAIPLQLDKSWILIGWAVEGLALIALWRRLDHPGLKWLALAHFAVVAFRLVPTAVLLGSYPRSAHRIVNWVLYTYLVPAAALFAGSRLLARAEVDRAKEWESGLYRTGKPVGAIATATVGIFVVFAWINVAIADWFADGPRLTLDFGRSPARDLTVSIAWAIYALVLLGFGMARSNIGLRWLSLSFLVVTIGKVFLYDLGELRDLYRVVSLVGLAVSLLLVSLLYQRFVFRRARTEGP